MYILLDIFASIYGVIRWIFLWIDSIGLTFIDNGYNLMIDAVSAFNGDAVGDLANSIARNCYIIIGIFALFRIAIFLVNSIINPDKFNEKGSGVGNMFGRIFITIILLIVVPLLFEKSRELQGMIVDNNYISKLIIGTDLGASNNTNPGVYVKDVAVRALIKPDPDIFKDANNDGNGDENGNGQYDDDEFIDDCNDECKAAARAWLNDAGIGTLQTYIRTYAEVGDENIYVYSYIPFVTLLVGGFITYILFSFAIDIAVRSVELIVLQILSPLFIVTFIDPKSSSSGPFKKWVSTCGKTFVSLFIKIGIVCLMLLFISKLDSLFDIANNPDSSGLLKLLMLIAILIFAKKSPKWIGDMIGVEGGLGELGIGKKLGGMALFGGLASKGIESLKNTGKGIGRGVVGATGTLANNKLRNLRHNRELKKDAGLTINGRKKYKNDYIEKHGGSAEGFRSAWKDKKKTLRDDYGLTSEEKRKRSLASNIGGMATGFKAGFKADKLTGAIKGGIEASNQFSDNQGLRGKPITQKIKDSVMSPYESMLSDVYGTEQQRFEARKRIMDANTREENTTEKGLKLMGGRDNEKFVASMGDFVKATKGGTARNFDDAIAMVRAYANGEDAYYNKNGQLEIKQEDGKIISGTALDKYTHEAKDSFTALGTARMEEMYNKSMQTIASEYESNDQYITRANQNIMSIAQNMKSFIATKPGVVSDPNTGALYAEYTDKDSNNNEVVRRIPLDLSDVDGTVARLQSVEDTTKDFGIQGKIKSYIEALTDNNMTNYRTAMAQSQNELQIALQRKGQIQAVYDNIGKEFERDADGNPMRDASGKIIYKDTGISTHQQKVDYLNNQARKTEKTIKEFEIKKDDKK
mgnify:CR=1 FL=1